MRIPTLEALPISFQYGFVQLPVLSLDPGLRGPEFVGPH